METCSCPLCENFNNPHEQHEHEHEHEQHEHEQHERKIIKKIDFRLFYSPLLYQLFTFIYFY